MIILRKKDLLFKKIKYLILIIFLKKTKKEWKSNQRENKRIEQKIANPRNHKSTLRKHRDSMK